MTEIASHRGGALLWPENSRTAFENTAKLPVEQVEFDVHPSKDGKLVVIHDATLERTTDGKGPVCEKSYAELATLTLKGTAADRILTLDEVIDLFAPTRIKLRIELKAGPSRVPYRDLPQQVAEVLRQRAVLDRSILTSFQLATVCEAARLARPSRHVFLVTPDVLTDLGLDALLELARGRGVPMLGLRWNCLTADVIAAVRKAGLGIGGWAVNDAEAITGMLALGVDVFTSDRPDLALRARQDLRAVRHSPASEP
jgi:glycerophosphoryl diester phosphodiesterase